MDEEPIMKQIYKELYFFPPFFFPFWMRQKDFCWLNCLCVHLRFINLLAYQAEH